MANNGGCKYVRIMTSTVLDVHACKLATMSELPVTPLQCRWKADVDDFSRVVWLLGGRGWHVGVNAPLICMVSVLVEFLELIGHVWS